MSGQCDGWCALRAEEVQLDGGSWEELLDAPGVLGFEFSDGFQKRSKGNLFLIKMLLRKAISSKKEPIDEQIVRARKRRHWIRPVLYLSWVKELCFINKPV